MSTVEIWQGRPNPLGATVTPEGVNFALYSENATGVELCLFENAEADQESLRVRMVEQTNYTWHCFVPGLKGGQLYGYRVHGPYEPKNGHRFNSSKLLLDPYAKAVTGLVEWGPEMFSYPQNGGDDADLQRDERNNVRSMPKSIVVDNEFDWEGDRLLDLPQNDTIYYEVHVKGFSKLCPHIPEEIRGTYAALAHPFAIEYFKKLGVTAIELLPVQHFLNDQFLEDKGLTNYWGYNTIAYFAPHSAYAHSRAVGAQVQEFKEMVKALHAAGIEVILDVVYNHTGEGNHFGPTVSFRGCDNATYYRLVQNDRRFYMDYTGTGNTLNMQHPTVLQLLMDSLRYWVEEMHVDGFRFDLASTLAREAHDVSKLSGFFDCIHQDPVISAVKLIAEPWDVGEGGYQVGNFPVLWAEWNGKYRDCLRAYWKGDLGQLGEMAYRLTGSADLFEDDGRKPYASVNFLTAHDGFTLNDTVSYNDKHNEANGENSQDGHNDNRSWNCGAEGPTEDEAVNTLRRRQLRNLLSTLILSQGVPMIVGGDEFARSQRGNNNAYCQDNDISWFDWNLATWQSELLEFTRKLTAIRHRHPVFRRPKFFLGRRSLQTGRKDVMWIDTDGTEMTEEDWCAGFTRCMGMLLSGDTLDISDRKSQLVQDDTFLVYFNSHHEHVGFVLPGKQDVRWELYLDTREESGFPPEKKHFAAGETLELLERSLVVLRLGVGAQASARSISWKKEQKVAAIPPPMPARPSKYSAIDPTTGGTRAQAREAEAPKLSDLAQGVADPDGPELQ